jgi:hypothetical protein
MTPPAVQLLQRGAEKPRKNVHARTKARTEETPPRRYRCRACLTPLCTREDDLPVGGALLHEEVNPGGFRHLFLTVARCAHVRSVGEPTLEHTWFPGYTWEVILCEGCGAALGWCYCAVDRRSPARFYGLIVDAILEDPPAA